MASLARASAINFAVLLVSGLGSPVAGQVGEPSALGTDDECVGRAGEPGPCALNALQHRSLTRTAGALDAEEGCHTMKEGEGGVCMKAIEWARHEGFSTHPEWYPGLDPETSNLADWQFQAYNSTHPQCPRPCNIPRKQPWCQSAAAPNLWAASAEGVPVEVKVLTYNLFWWHLFNVEHGRDNSAGRLIQSHMHPTPFDVMGFQECEDPERVLGPVGLLNHYTAFQGDHAICMAYRTAAWSLLAKGETDVAEDMRTEYYGKRGTQWMRLRHIATGRGLFFVNHHGPLSVNSGGLCGGRATAHNLLKVMASNAQVGDILILVGDFNANAGSRTIQSLWPHLMHVYNGNSFGGVDNIFSNVPSTGVLHTRSLGSGGSDHNAVSATLRAGPPAPPLGAGPCQTARQGDACWQEVQWARTQGISLHPDWYPGLDASSSLEQFQEKVHQESPDKCPQPCPPPGAGACHTAQQGDACWHEVEWAKTQGISLHPDWYPGLDASSSLEQFQEKVHQESPDKCPQPCLPPGAGSCRTAQQGDVCWHEVEWAKTQGITAHPDWYPGLDASSSVEQFQEKVHQESPDKCPKPCPAPGAAAPEPPTAPRPPSVTRGLEPSQAMKDLERARGSDGCLIEPDLQYVFARGGWSLKYPGVADPRQCCGYCSSHHECRGWMWTEWAAEAQGPQCLLRSGRVVNRVAKDGFVSGLPQAQAVREAQATSRLAFK